MHFPKKCMNLSVIPARHSRHGRTETDPTPPRHPGASGNPMCMAWETWGGSRRCQICLPGALLQAMAVQRTNWGEWKSHIWGVGQYPQSTPNSPTAILGFQPFGSYWFLVPLRDSTSRASLLLCIGPLLPFLFEPKALPLDTFFPVLGHTIEVHPGCTELPPQPWQVSGIQE